MYVTQATSCNLFCMNFRQMQSPGYLRISLNKPSNGFSLVYQYMSSVLLRRQLEVFSTALFFTALVEAGTAAGSMEQHKSMNGRNGREQSLFQLSAL